MRQSTFGWGIALVSAIASIVALPQSHVHAAGVFVSPCGVETFTGGASVINSCNVGGGATQNAISQGLGLAGLNGFENHISPVHYYGTTDDFAPGPQSWSVTTSPTWDTLSANTYLRLDGVVTLQGPGSAVTITLKGELGGPPLQIGPLTYGPLPLDWTGGSVEYPLNLEQYGIQATSNSAVETLTINIMGRARYDVDGSPAFAGGAGVPEPATLALLVVGAIASLACRQRRVS